MLQQSEPVARLNSFAPSWFSTCCTLYLEQQSVVAVLVYLHNIIWIAFSQYACCSGHQKELLPIEIIKREGMQAKGWPWAFQSPPPPPLYILLAYLAPQMFCRLLEGGRILLHELKSLLYVRSLVIVRDMNDLCYAPLFHPEFLFSQSPQHVRSMREWKWS